MAFGVAGEDAAIGAKGPGTFHVALYDALYNLDPATLDSRAKVGRVRLHAIVTDFETAPRAVEGGATVDPAAAQGSVDRRRRRDRQAVRRPARDVRRQRRRRSCARSRRRRRASRPRRSGRRARGRARAHARDARRRASRRRSRASSRRGLHRRRARSGRRRRSRTQIRRSGSTVWLAICEAVSVPVVAIGGIDAANAARLHRGGRGRGRRHPRAPSDCGGRSVRLSEVGELGLLAELEQRGLSRSDRERRGAARGRARRHPGRARRGRALPARLPLVARARLPRRRGQPQRSGRLGGGARSARRHAGVAAARPSSTTCSSSTKGSNEPGVADRRRRHDARRPSMLSVTALGRSERVPGRAGARPGDVLVVTGPLGARAPRSGAAARAPAASPRRRRELGARPRAARRLGRSRGRRGSHRRPLGVRCVIDLEQVPLAEGASSTTSGSARTTSCSPPWRIRDASRSSAAARRAGRRNPSPGEPVPLTGWDHFGTQGPDHLR